MQNLHYSYNGSHGGPLPKDNDILRGYNITEEFCGCPIYSSMEVKQIGKTSEGHPVLIDKYAAEADAIVVINRIKPHTAYRAL